MTRKEVFNRLCELTKEAPAGLRALKSQQHRAWRAIDSERNYQNSKWYGSDSARPDANERTIREFALYVHGYVNDLVQVASHFGETSKKLEIVRKIAALCVACFEQHGMDEVSRVSIDSLPDTLDEMVLALAEDSQTLLIFGVDCAVHNLLQVIAKIGALSIEALSRYGAPLRKYS